MFCFESFAGSTGKRENSCHCRQHEREKRKKMTEREREGEREKEEKYSRGSETKTVG